MTPNFQGVAKADEAMRVIIENAVTAFKHGLNFIVVSFVELDSI
jgi:hypothetical protein